MDKELIREVDAAVKQDKLQQMLKQYGMHLAYACVAAVVLVTAVVVWRGYMQGVHEAQTGKLQEGHAMYLSKRYGDAKRVFSGLTEEARGEMAAVAYVWLAKAQVHLGESNEAIESLAQIQKLGVDDSPIAKLACYQGSVLASYDERFHACLSAKPAEPLAATLAEWRAIISIKSGKTDGVKEALPDSTLLPVSQKQRVNDLNAYLSSSIHDTK